MFSKNNPENRNVFAPKLRNMLRRLSKLGNLPRYCKYIFFILAADWNREERVIINHIFAS